jgi:hypothetical protein
VGQQDVDPVPEETGDDVSHDTTHSAPDG